MHDENTMPTSGRRWWLEWEVGLLLVLVSILYFTRLTALNVRGEESRRARVAVEMIDSGDWIVPRQQGQLYFSRPPLQNWAIALIGLARGDVDTLAIRLPSVLAAICTVLLIYAYARSFLSRSASLAAAVAFATMVQVLELGRLGETDMMFTLFVSGSLLVWHYGHVRRWPAVWMWTAAYLFVALGTLAKGPQAPVYFVTTVAAFLLLAHRWRDALSWSHLAGIGVFLAVVGAWQVPYHLEVGWGGVLRIYGRNVAVRFDGTTWMTYVEHFFTYPLEILLGCLLPWSFLLVAYLNRDFRRTIGSARGHVLLLVCAIVVTFPILWFVPTARTRYFMPLYPCFALLVGLVVDRCWHTKTTAQWQRLWRQFLVVVAVLAVLAGLGVLAGTLLGGGDWMLAQPVWFAAAYALAAIVLSAAILRSRSAVSNVQRVASLVSIALFMGLSFVGVFTNSLVRRSEDPASMVAELKRQLPDDVHLVSFGRVHHLFAYYYRDMIEPLPVPEMADQLDAEVTYFCFHKSYVSPDDLPFPVEELAVIPCDRFKNPHSTNMVTVARATRIAPVGNHLQQ